ncbi:Regulatory protein RecX [Gammaproteobacteria bacterium]
MLSRRRDSSLTLEEARGKALDLLSRREHSKAELSRKLRSHGVEQEEANATVAKLAEESLQSDDRFLESFVSARISRGQGPRKVASELAARGVSKESVVIALSAVNWEKIAKGVRERRFGTVLPEDAKARVAQMRFLLQRGFSTRQAQTAVETEDDQC